MRYKDEAYVYGGRWGGGGVRNGRRKIGGAMLGKTRQWPPTLKFQRRELQIPL